MVNILRERLVNRSDNDSFRFALTCAVCMTVWQSTPIPVEGGKEQDQSVYSEAQNAAYQQATKQFVVCRLCGDPACERCHISLGKMTVCSNCAKQMSE